MSTYTDAFAYTHHTWLNAYGSWQQLYGSANPIWIVNGQASHGAAGTWSCIQNVTIGDDQYVEVDAVAMFTDTDSGISVLVRGSSSAYGAYFAQCSRYNGGEIILYRYHSGGYENLHQWAGTLTDNDRMRIEVSGQGPVHLSVKRNGSELFNFDHSTAGEMILTGKPGIFIGTPQSEGTVLMDNYEAGDLASINAGAGSLQGAGVLTGVGFTSSQLPNIYYRRRR